jgi:hypothetical protein
MSSGFYKKNKNMDGKRKRAPRMNLDFRIGLTVDAQIYAIKGFVNN